MCTRPITTIDQNTGREITFSCRTCDDCIVSRKNDWVARGMAEMATAAHTYVITLTYRNNPDGTKPDSARAFKYADVQAWLWRIRAAAKRKYGKGVEIRYIIAGERGTQKDRVHWHVVLYASHDLFKLGKWYDFCFKAIGQPRVTRMDHWSLWPHGHVVTDEATQASLAYVLKYCVKDFFNVVKAKGTKRIAKAENSGASMFRMSKQPPIGWRFIQSKLDTFSDILQVPPKLELKIPGYSGYWWPRGIVRQNYLRELYLINKNCREEKGRDCPAWDTLLASVSDNEKDMEILTYGDIQQESENETQEGFEEQLRKRQRETAYRQRAGHERRNCGNLVPCLKCFNGLSPRSKAQFKEWLEFQKDQYGSWSVDYVNEQFKKERRINPFCKLHDEKGKFFDRSAFL
jgi:hypothetical protein